MKRFFDYVAAFAFVFTLFIALLWIAGYSFDGTWADPFEYDHPENFTRGDINHALDPIADAVENVTYQWHEVTGL